MKPGLATLVFLLGLGAAAAPLRAQAQDGFRLGLSLGGTSLIGVVVERVSGRHALELTAGTWSFRDLSLSAAVKEYLGPSAMRPALGAGLWVELSRPAGAGRTGTAVVARFPVGFDWRAGPGHYVLFEMNVCRALWVRRTDPADETPPAERLIPLPGLSYRWDP